MPDSSLAPFDKKLADKIFFLNMTDERIIFQFVPKIVNESNGTEWEIKNQGSFQPIKYIKTGSGRKLTMEWEYIATDGVFTPSKIAAQIRKTKVNFYEFTVGSYPAYRLSYGELTGPRPAYFRGMDINITYSPELVLNGDTVFPLHTKISLGLELATNGSFKGEDEKMDVEPLPGVILDWY